MEVKKEEEDKDQQVTWIVGGKVWRTINFCTLSLTP